MHINFDAGYRYRDARIVYFNVDPKFPREKHYLFTHSRILRSLDYIATIEEKPQMALIPIGSDQKLKKVPVITIALIVINTIIWYHLKDLC